MHANLHVSLQYLLYVYEHLHNDNLFRKVCSLTFSRCERQWRDIAFCLSRMNYSEKGIRKIQDNFPCFADKLGEEDVYNSFVAVLHGAKSFAKPEIKVLKLTSYVLFDKNSTWSKEMQ